MPSGEFVPFARLPFLARPLVQAVGNFEPGGGPRLLGGLGPRFGALVCYEVIFPDLVRRFAAAGASFFVNITNDAWYERSAASAQHFAHLVFRAVGDRRHVLVSNRVANTISKIDYTTMRVVDEYPGPGGSDCMDLTADGRYILLASRWAGKLSIIELFIPFSRQMNSLERSRMRRQTVLENP